MGVFTRFSLGVRGLRVDVSYLKGINTFEYVLNLNGNVVRKMTLVTDVSGRIDQICLGFGCYMKTFCVSWPDVRYAYLSQYIEYIFCMRFQTV